MISPKNNGNRRLYTRRSRLLALLYALGGKIGNVDFQKLLFLYCQELPSVGRVGRVADPLYEFVPYRYGAFSFTCYADRRYLIDHGLVNKDENSWILTDMGKHIGREILDSAIRSFAHRYHNLRGDMLVAETYRRYPYYAIHSEIAERVLQGDETALSSIEAARPERKVGAFSTIGYEGRTLENYLNALIESNVTVLCDVRRNAISRKYGFSKATLAKACDRVGIHYEHLPELGIESQLRQGLKKQEDFDALFEMYKKRILPMRSDALEKIRFWLRSGKAVALTCYEREAVQCHRHCVSAAVGRDYTVRHI